MKVLLEKKSFSKALRVGGAFAGKSKAIPILDCVKILIQLSENTRSDEHYVEITSSDTKNTIKTTLGGIDTYGDMVEFCVSFKDLRSYVDLISGESLYLEYENQKVTITHDKGSFELVAMDASQFPVPLKEDGYTNVVLESGLLLNWIGIGKNFVDSDELRPIMNGIYFYSRDGEIGCCSSDRHTLFCDNIKRESENFEFVLNKESLNAVEDVLKSANSGVSIDVCEKNVSFSTGNAVITCRIIEGRFPNFKSVLPRNCNVVSKVSKLDIGEAVSRCSLASSITNRAVKLCVDDSHIAIESEDVDMCKKSHEKVLANSSGSVEISLNASQLLSILGCVSSDDAILNFTDKSHPCVIKEDKEDSNKIFLEMPLATWN